MFIPFAEWRPDVLAHNGQTSQLAQNVIARADGYAPFKQFAAFTRPLAEGNDTFMKILLHFDGTDAATTFTDSNAGGSAHTWTAGGNAQLDTAQFAFGTASLLLDGTGDWITTNDHADFTLGSANFSVHLRARPAANGTALDLCGQGNSTLTAATTSFYIERTAGNFIKANLSNGSSFTSITGATTQVTTGNFFDIEFSRSGTTLYLFVNGVLEGTTTFSGAVNDSANAFRVGAAGELTTTTWNGWIDEFALRVGVASHTAAFTPFTKAFDAPSNGRCRGLFYARKTDGSIVVFAGTSDATNGARLWRLDNTALDWVHVSIAAGYSALPTSYHWQFEQYGNFVVAVQPNVVPQVFDISSAAAFSALAGSPPQAAYVKTVGLHLVLSGLTGSPFTVQWSDASDITNWTTGLADSETFATGGITRGIAGGEVGYIFQDTIIRRMVSRFGDPVTAFQFEKITEDMGLLCPYSIVRSGERVFFYSLKGWQMIVGNGYPLPIGKEKWDRTFGLDLDRNQLQLVIGAPDPEGSRIFVGYKTGAGAAGMFDKILIYDYVLERGTFVTAQAGEYISTLSAPGLTLENLDALFPNLDTMTISLDDIALSQLPKVAMVDSTHGLGLFTGPNLEAIVETSESELDKTRIRIQGARIIGDAPTGFLSIGVREGMANAVTYTSEQAMDGDGFAPANVATRMARGRYRVPAGTTWSVLAGIDPTFRPEGRRR